MAKYGLNQVTLIGNLGKAPEIKYLDQGIAFTNLWMACTESYRDKNGQNIDRTEWISVNLWRGQAEIAAKYCKKGSTVCIHGRLKTRNWETPQGEKRSRTEVEGRKIILLDSKPVTSPLATPVAQPIAQNPESTASSNSQNSTLEKKEGLDDLPF